MVGPFPADIAQLGELRELDLYGNYISGTIPEVCFLFNDLLHGWLCFYSEHNVSRLHIRFLLFDSLVYLSFPRGGAVPQSIGLLPNLSALLLGGRIPDPTALGGSLPRSLATLPRLSRVMIAWYVYMISCIFM